MTVPVEVPTMGESITEAIIAEWNKKVGDYGEKDEVLVELETDKISVELVAPEAGVLIEIKAQTDDTVEIGDVVAVIDPSQKGTSSSAKSEPAQAKATDVKPAAAHTSPSTTDQQNDAITPAVARLLEENKLKATDIKASGPNGRLLKGDVLAYIESGAKSSTQSKAVPAPAAPEQREERVRMSKLRQTIAKRLVDAQQTAAMLTTFNEVDMSAVMALRSQYKDAYLKKHGMKLGFMPFFIKAVIEALKEYPRVNAEIDGNEIVYKNYYNIGVAVGGGKGLVVPVLRDADLLSFSEVETGLKGLIDKVLSNKVTLADMQGGTFTISNGGVYGSMLSTPILNSPQSGILGMHNIVERPVAINGEVVIRPIMYLALSYDHRIVDGKEAVSFLVRVKQCLENPERILLEI
jgi:2-oxoglutarate dehydrogenase E2 component (dihydrolipoamide succinyltransferase)